MIPKFEDIPNVMEESHQNLPDDHSANDRTLSNDATVQSYLAITDDGEIARIAAMMAPRSEVFDAPALIAQTLALQAEATAEFVRRREVVANSMSYTELIELAERLGFRDVGFVYFLDADYFTDPVTGPVLQRLAELMRAMPPPQDFVDQFLAEDPTAALDHAASRTALPPPSLNSSFEKSLRYASDIPADEVPWGILNGAFVDFLRIWFQQNLNMAELFPDEPAVGLTKSKPKRVLADLQKLQLQWDSFHDDFTPGQDFPPDINEIAHRAYTECWEYGLRGLSWRQRLAWLVVEFTPFWSRHGVAYRAIHDARVKSAEKAKAVLQHARNKKSAANRKAGQVGLEHRERKRLRSVTTDFIKFLETNSESSPEMDLRDHLSNFVRDSPLLGGAQSRANSLEFLGTLCTAVSAGHDARSVLDRLQRSKFKRIEASDPEVREKFLSKLSPSQKKEYESRKTPPQKWVVYKSLTEEAVSECLHTLKDALARLGVKK